MRQKLDVSILALTLVLAYGCSDDSNANSEDNAGPEVQSCDCTTETNCSSDELEQCRKSCPDACPDSCDSNGKCPKDGCPEECKNGCNEDGSCKETCPEECKNGCNDDGSCKETCPEECTIVLDIDYNTKLCSV